VIDKRQFLRTCLIFRLPVLKFQISIDLEDVSVGPFSLPRGSTETGRTILYE